MPNHYTTMAVCSPGYEFDCDAFNEQHKDLDLCRVVMPMPESIEQIKSVSYPDGTTERSRQGVEHDWYSWAIENWGTKWGTYDVTAFPLGGDTSLVLIKFQSAWGPPKILDKIAAWLMKVYQFEQVAFVGFDPYDDSTTFLSTHQASAGEDA